MSIVFVGVLLEIEVSRRRHNRNLLLLGIGGSLLVGRLAGFGVGRLLGLIVNLFRLVSSRVALFFGRTFAARFFLLLFGICRRDLIIRHCAEKLSDRFTSDARFLIFQVPVANS